MQHPVFLNLKTILVYSVIWILLAGIQLAFLVFQYAIPFEIALADSVLFNVLFGLIGLSLWYVVRYTSPTKISIFNLVFNHLTSLVLFLVIWLGLSNAVLWNFFAGEPKYIIFLSSSIPFRIISGILLYSLLGLTFYLFIYNANLKEKLKQEARLNTLLKEAELNMLKSQINPHFLFNSLNSISSLTISNPEKARDMVIKLSEFLRYSVSTDASSFTTISKELENITRYLEIEKVRFGEKLVYELDVNPGCLTRTIPVMLLQPLVENAIKHGVYESTDQVTIKTTCTPSETYTEILIVNDFDPEAIPRKGAGLGLKNIRERLRIVYKQLDLITILTRGNQFEVILRIPYE